jgi:hypothetical protein
MKDYGLSRIVALIEKGIPDDDGSVLATVTVPMTLRWPGDPTEIVWEAGGTLQRGSSSHALGPWTRFRDRIAETTTQTEPSQSWLLGRNLANYERLFCPVSVTGARCSRCLELEDVLDVSRPITSHGMSGA